MNSKSAFCWAMLDLDACVRSTNHYHQLRIAGLLRLLIFDENPLTSQVSEKENVARSRKDPLHFRHLEELPDDVENSTPTYVADGLRVWIADLLPTDVQLESNQIKNSDLAKWSRARCFRVDENVLTIREFTKTMAYLEGLTHPSRPKSNLEHDLIKVRDTTRTDELSEPNLHLLRQIGRIAHTALYPTFERIAIEVFTAGKPYPQFLHESATDYPKAVDTTDQPEANRAANEIQDSSRQ